MKPLTIICFVMFAINAHAQIGKGKNVLSGNILYLTTNGSSGLSAENSFSSLSIMPRYGHLFGEKTEVGITIGYNWMSENGNDNLSYYTGKSTTGLFLVGPYARFYKNLAERFYFNLTVNATVFTGTQKVTTTTYWSTSSKTEYDAFEFQAGIGPGLTYFFNDHWATNFSLGVINYDMHSSTNKKTDIKTTTDTFTFGINAGGLGFGVGFYF
jgi:hypothetical protein